MITDRWGNCLGVPPTRSLHPSRSWLHRTARPQPALPSVFQSVNPPKACLHEDLRRTDACFIARAGAVSNYLTVARNILEWRKAEAELKSPDFHMDRALNLIITIAVRVADIYDCNALVSVHFCFQF